MRRIDHVGIVVRSIDASLDYYTKILGLDLIADGPRPDGSVRLAYLAAGDTTVQLVEPLALGPVAHALELMGEGLHHICFAVDDLEAALSGLPGEGDQPVEDGGLGCRVAFLSAVPSGVRIELSEGPRQANVDGLDGMEPALFPAT